MDDNTKSDLSFLWKNGNANDIKQLVNAEIDLHLKEISHAAFSFLVSDLTYELCLDQHLHPWEYS